MSQRKFISEFGLNMVSGYSFLLQQDGLERVAESGIDPHIYLICRRPRITLDPDSITFTQDRVKGRFQKQIRNDRIDIPFEVENRFGTSDLIVDCTYPNTHFFIRNSQGSVLLEGKSANLLALSGPEFSEHLDLEVLYVGQSYGTDGSRNAGKRLKTHETLQGIYSEAMQRNPDQDIWLVLFTFEPLLLASFDGTAESYGKSKEEDSQHIENILKTEISEQQRINFTEAAIIKYFQPEYNKTFKKTFPNPAHSTYKECYDIDLNMVSVEIQTDQLRLNLWSDAAKSSWVHFCSFPLHSREERVYMFELPEKQTQQDAP